MHNQSREEQIQQQLQLQQQFQQQQQQQLQQQQQQQQLQQQPQQQTQQQQQQQSQLQQRQVYSSTTIRSGPSTTTTVEGNTAPHFVTTTNATVEGGASVGGGSVITYSSSPAPTTVTGGHLTSNYGHTSEYHPTTTTYPPSTTSWYQPTSSTVYSNAIPKSGQTQSYSSVQRESAYTVSHDAQQSNPVASSYAGMSNQPLGPTATSTTTTTTTAYPTTTIRSSTTSAGMYTDTANIQEESNVVDTTTASRAVSNQSGTAGSEWRVIGREVGEGRLISVTERVDDSRSHILSERIVEHEIRVPKKILREEIIEKVIVVPERTIVEEIVDETAIIKEKIVEVARPRIVEKTIETPEIEFVERIVEVPRKLYREKLIEEERIERRERIIENKVIERREKIVEVPEVEYRVIPVEKLVEVIEPVEEVKYVDVPVPTYVDKPVPRLVTTEVPVDVERMLPVPVEAEVTYEYRMPQLKPRYAKVTYPVYLPRFIEVPVAVELLSSGLAQQAEGYLKRIDVLTKSATSLCEIESLAATIMKTDFQSQLASADLQSAIMRAWNEGSLQLDHGHGRPFVGTTTSYVASSGPIPMTTEHQSGNVVQHQQSTTTTQVLTQTA